MKSRKIVETATNLDVSAELRERQTGVELMAIKALRWVGCGILLHMFVDWRFHVG